MCIPDNPLGNVDVMEDPVDTKVLGDNVSDHQDKADIQRQRARHADEPRRDVQPHYCRNVQKNKPAQLQTTKHGTMWFRSRKLSSVSDEHEPPCTQTLLTGGGQLTWKTL